MKVTSCDCFEKTGIDVSKCTYTDGLFTLGKEETSEICMMGGYSEEYIVRKVAGS